MSTSPIELFLSSYPKSTQTLSQLAIETVSRELPDCEIVLDLPAKMIAFTYGPGYKDMICVLFPSQKGVKLSFSKGVELSLKFPFLTGDGKKTRYVELNKNLLKSSELVLLIQTARQFYLNSQ